MADIDFTKLPAFHSAEEILAHPRFPIARDEFVRAILDLYEHKPVLNRLLLEASRTVLVVVIMCLHARGGACLRLGWQRPAPPAKAVSWISSHGSSGPAISNAARRRWIAGFTS